MAQPEGGFGEVPAAVSGSDRDYFSSYADLDVHELMLKDKPRTSVYQKFIQDNAAVFKDKVVVDIGAGTGILSLFAAKAGAQHVYAIEASNIADLCKAIVVHNNLEDRITVLNCSAESAVLPSGEKADILISEWMGFYLLHESMLNSVICARDRLLKPEGLIVPSSASLYVCPVSMREFQEDKFDFWSSVYGFDFSPVLPHIQQQTLSRPQILTVKQGQCLADAELVTNLDLKYVEPEDIAKIVGQFKFRMTKNGVMHGITCWFDVDFEGETSSLLSTGPGTEPTHWKQTVVLLPDALLVSKGESVKCNMLFQQSSENLRRYDISLEIPEEEDEDEEEEDSNQDDAADMIISAMGQSGTNITSS